MNTKQREFIIELETLTRKYGISIGGCGCCGSPWLEDDADVSDDQSGYAYYKGDNRPNYSYDEGDECINLRWVAPTNSEWKYSKNDIIK